MLTSTQLAEAFAALLTKHCGVQVIDVTPPPPVWWTAECDALRELPLDFLRVLWDLYDGCNSPLGFSGETIHAVLNERGDGAYCAV